MKIVLDNTVLVRAHEHAYGLGRELLSGVTESPHVLLLSNEMLHELVRVLRYPRLQEFYDLTENLIYDYLSLLRRSAEFVTLNPLLTAPIRDVNDLIVVQTANFRRAFRLPQPLTSCPPSFIRHSAIDNRQFPSP